LRRNPVHVNMEVEVVMLTSDPSHQGIDSPATGNPVCDLLALQHLDEGYDVIRAEHAQPPLMIRIVPSLARIALFRGEHLGKEA